jgi:NADH-quinone oxidoreductase subunit N
MNWALALPEIALGISGLAILMVGVFRRRDATFLCSMLTLGALLLAALLVVLVGSGIAYRGQFVVDQFSTLIKLLVTVAAAMTVLMSIDFNARERLARFEFPVLMLFATLGMLVMASASNLMTLYLGLELNSLSVYVLAAFARDSLRSSEAGLKYFVLGSLASGLLLYGISLVYGFAGSMGFDPLVRAIGDPSHASAGLIVGVVFVIAGLAFKVSAVPFHMWTPS